MIMGLVGLIVFAFLISLAFIESHKTSENHSYELILSRNTLSVGQSAGFAVTQGDTYFTNFSARTEGDQLVLQDTLFTATKPGTCTLMVEIEGTTLQAVIEIASEPKTDEVVLASITGKRYHKDTANHAGQYAFKMTEEDALQMGKTPCRVCYRTEEKR